MIAEVTPESFIIFESFRAMRFIKTKCELNLIAEFLKFCTHKFTPNLISYECVRNVLESEEMPIEIVNLKVNNFKETFGDGNVNFEMFYQKVMGLVPE
jgi:hypothetical protein